MLKCAQDRILIRLLCELGSLLVPAKGCIAAQLKLSFSTTAPGTSNVSLYPMQMKMVQPVIAADGHTYERSAIEKWLKQHKTSPVSGQPLAHQRIVSNHIVKSIMGVQ